MTARIWAITETTKASFVVDSPPSAEDLRRWKDTAEMPGLACAEWTATEDVPLR